MGRKERRYQKKAAKEVQTRKPVRANTKVLAGLAVATVAIVLITYYLRYSGHI